MQRGLLQEPELLYALWMLEPTQPGPVRVWAQEQELPAQERVLRVFFSEEEPVQWILYLL